MEKRPPLDDSYLGAVSNTSDTVSERLPNDDPERVPKMEYSIDHYEAIRAGVIDSSIKPTLKPVKAALVSLNIKFIDDASRQKKASNILAQLFKEGVLIDNSEFGSTGKVVAKYILNPDAKQADKKDLESDESPMTCQCPECGKLEEVRATNLAGKVRSVCCVVYVASHNQVNVK